MSGSMGLSRYKSEPGFIPVAGVLDPGGGMASSRKSPKTAKAGKSRSEKPRNLPKRGLDAQETEAVRGGTTNMSDLPVVKVIDKASPKFLL